MSTTTLTVQGPVIVLPLENYERLLRQIEDLEDALALCEAKAKTTDARPYSEFRAELVKEGFLEDTKDV